MDNEDLIDRVNI